MEDSSENKKSIKITDGTADVTPPTVDESPSQDELASIESENESTSGTTSAPIDNDHTVNDVVTERKLATTSDALVREKTKRRSRPFLVVLLSLLMIALGAFAGIMVYRAYFAPTPTTQTTTSTTATPAPATSPNAAALVAAIKPLLKSTPLTTGERMDRLVLTDKDYVAYSVPYVQPSGYSYETVPVEISGVATTASAQTAAEADVLAAKRYLESKNLTAGGTTNDSANAVIASTEYISKDVRCLVDLTNYDNAFQAHVGCADVASYTANATRLKPLYTALSASTDTSAVEDAKAADLILGLANIVDSKTAGYKNASVSVNRGNQIGGYVALFYQTSDGKWHYFRGVQNILACSDYNTPDLKKAFTGTRCMTNNTESTVAV